MLQVGCFFFFKYINTYHSSISYYKMKENFKNIY